MRGITGLVAVLACASLCLGAAAVESLRTIVSRQSKVDTARILSTFELAGTTPAIKGGQCAKSIEFKDTSPFEGSDFEKTLEKVLGGPSTVITAIGGLVAVIKHNDIELDVACKGPGEVAVASPQAVQSLLDLTANAYDLGNLTSLANSAKGLLKLVEDSGVAVGYDQAPRKCGTKMLFSGYLWLDDLGGEATNVARSAGIKNPKKGDLYLIASPNIPDDPDSVVEGTAPLCIYKDERRGVEKTDASSEPSQKDNDGSSCFPAHGIVEVQNRGFLAMDELIVGDCVRVGPNQFSEVFMWTHKLDNVLSEFVNLEIECGQVLTLSPGHYVPTGGELIPAHKLRKGDKVTLASGRQCSISRTFRSLHRGLFNPQTIDGSIVVDGVVTSTYTTAVQPKLAHVLLAPLRMLYRWCGLFVTVSDASAKPPVAFSRIK